MRTASRFIATAVLAAGISVSGASAALAQDACPYVEGCETPIELLPNQLNRTEVNARTVVGDDGDGVLPFTGGEITMAALAGTGAVAAGVALVVASRRRTASDS